MNQDVIFSKVSVIGAGQMGSGIAQICASKGITTCLIDLNQQKLSTAKEGIAKSATKLRKKDAITQGSYEAILGKIEYNTDINSAAESQLVIEAVNESESLKREIFSTLDQLMPKSAVFASNTSSLPITRLSSYTSRPENFIGMHFMNPVPIMKLVEIIPGLRTAPETTQKVTTFAHILGKETCTSKDYPGFVVNRILMPMINEAFTVLMEGIATAEDIDKGMTLGTNQPMGPLALADFIGLDTCLSIMEIIHSGLGDSKYRPSPLLRQYVEAGLLGRKTKQGVYQY